MKKSFPKMLAMLLALVFIMNISAVFAEASEATPTDLRETAASDDAEGGAESQPAESGGNESSAEEQSGESGSSAELIVTRFVRPGDSWSGRVSAEKPALLKLDVNAPAAIYLIVETEQAVQAAVMASDRPKDVLKKALSDSRTGTLILSWAAEQGSYLIQISPEDGGSARVKALFLTEEQYAAFEAAQAAEAEQEVQAEPETEAEPEVEAEPVEAEQETEAEPVDEAEPETGAEPETEIEPEAEPETDPDQPADPEQEQAEEEPGELPEELPEDLPEELPEEPEFTLPENRSVHIDLSWDTDHPQIGDTAHFTSALTGYDSLTYSLQWQTSRDGETWDNYPGATGPQLDVVYTREVNGLLFRLLVYVESEQPAD